MDHSLSKHAGQSATRCTGKWNCVTWRSRLPLCHSGQQLSLEGHEGSPKCHQGPVETAEALRRFLNKLFLAHTQAHGDGTDLKLPLANSFHQENALATRVGGPTSNQQPWELVFCSTRWKLAYSFGKNSHVTEEWVSGLENSTISSPVLEIFPKECHSGA